MIVYVHCLRNVVIFPPPWHIILLHTFRRVVHKHRRNVAAEIISLNVFFFLFEGGEGMCRLMNLTDYGNF